jgi:sulfite reductase alpha subunit-like flavoprotein
MASTSTQQPRRALVVYGSETGNAQDVAEELGRLAVRLRFETHVAELDAVTLVGQTSDCSNKPRWID